MAALGAELCEARFCTGFRSIPVLNWAAKLRNTGDRSTLACFAATQALQRRCNSPEKRCVSFDVLDREEMSRRAAEHGPYVIGSPCNQDSTGENLDAGGEEARAPEVHAFPINK